MLSDSSTIKLSNVEHTTTNVSTGHRRRHSYDMSAQALLDCPLPDADVDGRQTTPIKISKFRSSSSVHVFHTTQRFASQPYCERNKKKHFGSANTLVLRFPSILLRARPQFRNGLNFVTRHLATWRRCCFCCRCCNSSDVAFILHIARVASVANISVSCSCVTTAAGTPTPP